MSICQQVGGAFLQWDGTLAQCFLRPSADLHDMRAWTSAGTYSFVVPAGITRLWVRLVGGGGGGGGASPQGTGNNGTGWAGGGGGAGGDSEGFLNVTPGQTLTATVGAGGVGGPGATNNSTGGTGETTSFGSSMSATGGTGGASANWTCWGGMGDWGTRRFDQSRWLYLG